MLFFVRVKVTSLRKRSEQSNLLQQFFLPGIVNSEFFHKVQEKQKKTCHSGETVCDRSLMLQNKT